MDIFDKLKKVFSTGLIVSDVKSDSIKVIDTNRSQAYTRRNSFTSKLHRNQAYQNSISQNYSVNRTALYRDYDMMDADPILSSALDIYVFQALQKDEFGDILQIKSQDSQIEQTLRQLFYQRLNGQFNFSVWFRNFVKYGDFPLALRLDQQYGIIGAQPVSPYDFQRVEDEDDSPQGYYFRINGVGNQLIQNYNIAHFRLLRDTNFLPYGKSVLEPARRIWKSLSLMIDAMMIQRIMRAPQRRVFKIQVGDLPNEQIAPYMMDVINKMKKIPYKDPQTGQINLKYNMQNILDDYYIPVRGSNDGSSVQTLSGMENNMIQDIQFIKSYMMAALKIPKAFLGFEQGLEGKATLAGLDIIFARYIEDLQNLFINELNRIALIHLFILGHTDLGDIDFTLSLNNPSNVKQIQQMQLWQQKVQLGKQMQESGHFSINYIFEHIYELNAKESVTMLKQILKDAKYRKKIMDIQSGEDGQSPIVDDNYGQIETEEEPQSNDYNFTSQIQDDVYGQQEEQVDKAPLENNFNGNSPLNVD